MYFFVFWFYLLVIKYIICPCSEKCYRTGVAVLKLPEWGNMPLLPISLCYWSRGGAVVGKQKKKYMGREGKSRRLRGGGTFQSFPLKGALYVCQRLQHEDYVRDSVLLYYSFYFCSMYVCMYVQYAFSLSWITEWYPTFANQRILCEILYPFPEEPDTEVISAFLTQESDCQQLRHFYKKTYYMFYYINLLYVVISNWKLDSLGYI